MRKNGKRAAALGMAAVMAAVMPQPHYRAARKETAGQPAGQTAQKVIRRRL